uniref:Sema domain-containing protein n=1 Tax=Eptatretus burgeri TaxID=7764 RepID=A0A8C4NK64_EPTBU
MVLIALLVLGLLVFEVSIADLPAVKIFSSKTQLNHMVVDSINTGEVYVGAVNYLYHLSPTLECYEERNTGPRNDSRKCLPDYDGHCDVRLTNSSNQLLVLSPNQKSLIVCGSLLMGTCMQLNSSNISRVMFQHKYLSYNLMVASNDPKVPSVAVIVNFPKSQEPTLLVGTGKPFAEDIKPISTRSLTGGETFMILKENMELRIKEGTDYQFHFILAFQENEHAYFLFTRLAKEDKNKRKTYLASLCVPQKDDYKSYIEVPLSCMNEGVAKDAFVGAIGTQLATNMKNSSNASYYEGVKEGSKALFVSFISHESATDKTDTKSAICIFTLPRLEAMVIETRKNCYSGDYKKAFVQYHEHLSCKTSTKPTNTPNVSHLRKLMFNCFPLLLFRSAYHRCTRRSDCPNTSDTHWLWSHDQHCLKPIVTPMNASRNAKTEVFLMKSLRCPGVRPSVNFWFPSILRRTPCAIFSFYICIPLSKVTAFNKTSRTSSCFFSEQILKRGEIKCNSSLCSVTVYKCSVGREDCSLCQTADAELECTWCAKDHRCVFKTNCTSKEEPSKCPAPRIVQIFPKNGTLEGGSRVTIKGHDLGQKHEDIESVTVVNKPCEIDTLLYSISSRSVIILGYTRFAVAVESIYANVLSGLELGVVIFVQQPKPKTISPKKGPVAGGTQLTVSGTKLKVGMPEDVEVQVGGKPCRGLLFFSFFPSSGGRDITVKGSNLDSVTHPIMRSVVSTARRRRRSHHHQMLSSEVRGKDSIKADIQFIMDNFVRNFSSIQYFADPTMLKLNVKDPTRPYIYKLDTILVAEGQNLARAMSKEEVQARLGNIPCTVSTLIDKYLYCNPESGSEYPKKPVNFTVVMGNVKFNLGPVEYENEPAMKLEYKIALAIGAVILALFVITIIFIYRRKSKKAIRDYKKVQVQLESLETNVRDTCKKQFTDLMTEMNDMSGDIMGSGTPFLDYKLYAERVFFPGLDSPLSRELDVPAAHKVTIEHGLNQLSNLLNSRLFLTTFIHTLESQRTFTARDRGYVASLLTVALHSKLEYYTDILKTLLKDLMDQYVAKNPKLMLRRTETVVEKMLTNWISICLYNFLKVSGESLFMLYKAIKHQVEKGPVDAIIKKAKYSLNDNRLLGEDVEYHPPPRSLSVSRPLAVSPRPSPARSFPFPHFFLKVPSISYFAVSTKLIFCTTLYIYLVLYFLSSSLEWRNGRAGHLLLCDEDVSSVDDGRWKKINTLQHYKVPNEASVALVSQLGNTQDYQGHQTPMLEDGEDGGQQPWHLVKASDDVDMVRKNRRSSSMRERDRTKAIPEIYLTRLLSMKGILQKFVDDFFRVVLSTSLPVPLAVKYFFDFLDQQADMNGINDPETIHIWKTNSLPLRFWVNILKNPHFVFDVHVSDIVDASLSVIAQTFMDSCTTTEQRLGRDSPINKLLYAREISGYKKMVEKYYSDIRQMIPVSDQEMNTMLAEESRAHSHELNSIVALHELYKYVIKYYDEIISALESNEAAQKIELAYRLQQVAAAVENKVTEV